MGEQIKTPPRVAYLFSGMLLSNKELTQNNLQGMVLSDSCQSQNVIRVSFHVHDNPEKTN